MKRALIAALCSGFVLPGLGQIINRNLIKGIAITFGFNILLIALLTDLGFEAMDILNNPPVPVEAGETITSVVLKGLALRDTTLIWVLAGLMAVLWVFGVVDAFVGGLRRDRAETRDREDGENEEGE